MGLIDPVVAPGRWAARWPAALAWDDATPRRPVPSTAGLAAVGTGHRGPRAGRPAARPGRTPGPDTPRAWSHPASWPDHPCYVAGGEGARSGGKGAN